jgi:hypothetical protein
VALIALMALLYDGLDSLDDMIAPSSAVLALMALSIWRSRWPPMVLVASMVFMNA